LDNIDIFKRVMHCYDYNTTTITRRMDFDAQKWIIQVGIIPQHVFIVEWYIENIDPKGKDLLGASIRNGCMYMAEWLYHYPGVPGVAHIEEDYHHHHYYGNTRGTTGEKANQLDLSLESLDLYVVASNGDTSMLEWMRMDFHITHDDARLSLAYACAYGHLGFVQRLHELFPLSVLMMDPDDIQRPCPVPVDAASSTGQYDIVSWLLSHGHRGSFLSVDYAAKNGHHDILVILSENQIRGTSSVVDTGGDSARLTAIDHTVANGFPLIMTYLASRGYYPGPQALVLGAKNFQLETLWLLHATFGNYLFTARQNVSQGDPGFLTMGVDAMTVAAKKGYLPVVEMLETCGYGPHPKVKTGCPGILDAAAGSGHCNLVRYLIQHGYPCTHVAMEKAAKRGSLDIIVVLSDHGNKPSPRSMCNAAAAGHVPVMQYLHTRHRLSRVSASTIFDVVRNGHLHVLRYLQKDGVMLPYAWIAEFATYLGHVPIVDFATTARTLQAIRADLMLTPNLHSFRTSSSSTVETGTSITDDQENVVVNITSHSPMFAPAAGPYTQYSSQSVAPAYGARRRLPFTPVPRLN